MKNLVFIFLLFSVFACDDTFTLPEPEIAQTSTFPMVTNQRYVLPVDLITCVPCSNGGKAENVIVSGNLMVNAIVTFHTPQSFTAKLYYQALDVKGVGETTGNVYEASNSTQVISFNQGENRKTFLNDMNGPVAGMPPVLVMKDSYFVRISESGKVSVQQVNINFDCK